MKKMMIAVLIILTVISPIYPMPVPSYNPCQDQSYPAQSGGHGDLIGPAVILGTILGIYWLVGDDQTWNNFPGFALFVVGGGVLVFVVAMKSSGY